MSRLELALARKWGVHADAFVIVGDPFQNLYEWRGSEPEAFTHGDAENVLVLEQSYRVPRAVHKYAVEWAAQITSMPFPAYLPRDADGAVRVAQHVWQYPETLLRDIQEDLDEGKDVMVLASCGFMLNPLIGLLRDRGLPFHNPYRKTHGGWNPLRGAGRVLSFVKPQLDNDIWTWADVHNFVEPLAAKDCLVRGAKTWIEAKATLHNRFDDERDAEPVDLHLLLEQFTSDVHRQAVWDGDLNWYLDHARAGRKQQLSYPVAVAQKHGLEALRKEPKLMLGTIHSVKGGEADVVYVFPDLSRAAGDEYRRARDPITRLFYVAMTRARDELVLCNPTGRDRVVFKRPS